MFSSSVYQTHANSPKWNCRFDYYLLQTEERFREKDRKVYSLLVTETRAQTVVDHALFYDIGRYRRKMIDFLDSLARNASDLEECVGIVEDFLCKI